MDNYNLLDPALDLEGEFYAEGHELGKEDGRRDGYNEGSIFAVEKGFEKFQEMGKLYGKAIVWAKRLPDQYSLLHQPPNIPTKGSLAASSASKTQDEPDTEPSNFDPAKYSRLPVLDMNPRLEKHITTFLLLVDPVTLSMENTEEDIFNFDDRLRRGIVQAKLLEKFVGEPKGDPVISSQTAEDRSAVANIEDI